MNNSFHNSIGEQGKNLIQFEMGAKAQTDYILDWLRIYPEQDFTRDELHAYLFKGTKVPVSSVGRSLTNLLTDKKIFVTGKRMGILGVKQNTHKIIAH